MRTAGGLAVWGLLALGPTLAEEAAPNAALTGGAATVAVRPGRDAFDQPSPLLEDAMGFRLGQALFGKTWVAAPASTRASDGLGPQFDARACADCHRGAGRGHPPESAEAPHTSFVMRIAAPDGGPHPTYGVQLQPLAARGLTPEGRAEIRRSPLPVTLADGTVVVLQAPTYRFAADPQALLSPRIAPQLIGLGLLEAIPEAAILAGADPGDRDGDGISGVARQVEGGLGRFGWKAESARLRDQVAAAFAIDMGLSSPARPAPWGDCTPAQTACRAAPTGEDAGQRDGREVPGEALDLVTDYVRNLGVPARRAPGAVLRGKAVFEAAGCPACHQPAWVTAPLPDHPAQGGQLIWPHTDLLLHDMGPGLADPGPGGAEWRTPPLWGLGLTGQVSGHSRFLHDGRAQSLLEAVLWHGGEAQASRDRVVGLSTADRDALIAFLGSL